MHLDDLKLITWHVRGEGRYVDIDEVTYSSALVAIGEGTDRHHNTTGATKRHNCGMDLGYQITNKICFTTGPRIAVDNTITTLAVEACNVLVDTTIPAVVLNGIRLYQSRPVPGAKGLSEYLLCKTSPAYYLFVQADREHRDTVSVLPCSPKRITTDLEKYNRRYEELGRRI